MAAVTNMHNRIKLIVLLVFACLVAAAIWNSETLAKLNDTDLAKPIVGHSDSPPPAEPKPDDVTLEGCVKCHNNIEPMHKFNSSGDIYDTLKDGKDAQGLSCTSCHGGNPVAATQAAAHVQPRFPGDWSQALRPWW